MTEQMTPTIGNGDIFTELKQMLFEEITLNEKLRDVLKQKQRAIIENNLEELRHCIEEEQLLIQATKDKAELLEEYIRNAASSSAKPSLKEIIKNAPENLKSPLERGRQRLITSLEEISQLNRENRFLLNFSLEHIKGVIHLLLKSEDENAKLYNYRGQIFLTEKNHKTLNVQI